MEFATHIIAFNYVLQLLAVGFLSGTTICQQARYYLVAQKRNSVPWLRPNSLTQISRTSLFLNSTGDQWLVARCRGALCFVHYRRMVWNQGLAAYLSLVIEDHATFFHLTLVGAPLREGSEWDFVIRTYLEHLVVLEHFKRRSGRVTNSESGIHLGHDEPFWGP